MDLQNNQSPLSPQEKQKLELLRLSARDQGLEAILSDDGSAVILRNPQTGRAIQTIPKAEW